MADNIAKLANLMAACIGCRRCEKVCPSFAHGGCDPYLEMQGLDGNVGDCIGCGRCSEVCPSTDPKQVMLHRKQEVKDIQVPAAFAEFGTVSKPAGEEWRGELPDMLPGKDAYFMPGCIVESRTPYLKYAGWKALEAVGVGSAELPRRSCCMYPVALRSMTDGQRDAYKYRVRDSAGGRPIVTLCAGCANELERSGVAAPHIVTELAKHVEGIERLPGLDIGVALEPGCSAERLREDFEAVVRATGAELAGNPSGCCGKSVPRISGELMAERQAECAGADAIVVGCPNCFRFYDAVEGGIPVLHIAELVALAAGDDSTQRFHALKITQKA